MQETSSARRTRRDEESWGRRGGQDSGGALEPDEEQVQIEEREHAAKGHLVAALEHLLVARLHQHVADGEQHRDDDEDGADGRVGPPLVGRKVDEQEEVGGEVEELDRRDGHDVRELLAAVLHVREEEDDDEDHRDDEEAARQEKPVAADAADVVERRERRRRLRRVRRPLGWRRGRRRLRAPAGMCRWRRGRGRRAARRRRRARRRREWRRRQRRRRRWRLHEEGLRLTHAHALDGHAEQRGLIGRGQRHERAKGRVQYRVLGALGVPRQDVVGAGANGRDVLGHAGRAEVRVVPGSLVSHEAARLRRCVADRAIARAIRRTDGGAGGERTLDMVAEVQRTGILEVFAAAARAVLVQVVVLRPREAVVGAQRHARREIVPGLLRRWRAALVLEPRIGAINRAGIATDCAGARRNVTVAAMPDLCAACLRVTLVVVAELLGTSDEVVSCLRRLDRGFTVWRAMPLPTDGARRLQPNRHHDTNACGVHLQPNLRWGQIPRGQMQVAEAGRLDASWSQQASRKPRRRVDDRSRRHPGADDFCVRGCSGATYTAGDCRRRWFKVLRVEGERKLRVGAAATDRRQVGSRPIRGEVGVETDRLHRSKRVSLRGRYVAPGRRVRVGVGGIPTRADAGGLRQCEAVGRVVDLCAAGVSATVGIAVAESRNVVLQCATGLELLDLDRFERLVPEHHAEQVGRDVRLGRSGQR